MDDQAAVSGGRSNGQPEGVVGSLADFANDVASLAELQARLAQLDMKDAAQRATIPLVVALGLAAVLLACIPVAIVGVGLLIATATGLSYGLALLLTALGVMVVSAIVAVVMLRRVGRSLDVFRRSQEELKRNVSWIRTVLLHSGRAAPKRRW